MSNQRRVEATGGTSILNPRAALRRPTRRPANPVADKAA
jgi:hypothetical protein